MTIDEAREPVLSPLGESLIARLPDRRLDALAILVNAERERRQETKPTPVVIDGGGVPLVLDAAQTCASCGDTVPAGKRAVRFDEVDTRYAEAPAYTCDALRCFQSFMR